MNDEKNNSTGFANKILNIFKKKKKTFLSILIILILALISINILKIYKDDKNKKIAEKFIQAGLLTQPFAKPKESLSARTTFQCSE